VLLLSGHAWHLLELPVILKRFVIMLFFTLSSHENGTHLKMVLHEAIRQGSLIFLSNTDSPRGDIVASTTQKWYIAADDYI
jgi:hypothetical protein